MYDHGHFLKGNVLQILAYLFHVGLVLLGLLFLTGGTYGVAEQIKEAYASGEIGMFLSFPSRVCARTDCLIGSVFSCADNSNSS